MRFPEERKQMRSVETRIHAHQEHIDALAWTVEWRKNSRSKWNKYCKCYTVGEAEGYRELCRDLKGGYPELYLDRWKTTKFRCLADFGYFVSDTVKVEYKQGLGKWHSLGNYDNLDVAIEVIEKVKKGVRHLHKFGGRKLINDFYKTCESTILCIRFPFLYPRNRFSGKHYNDCRLDERIKNIHDEAFVLTNPVKIHKDMSEEEIYNANHPKYVVKDFTKAISFYALTTWEAMKRFFHCIPTYTELDAMDSGWRKAFGIEICKEIKQVLKKNGYLKKYRITQIKEKWGELCWYDCGAPKEVFDIVRKYESISYRTCIECGKLAKYRSTGWVEPYCEDCLPKTVRDSGNYVPIIKNKR